jgi:hypothetical protein
MDDESRDRWLIDGDCTKCRRKEYCDTEFTASKRATCAFIREEIRKNLRSDKIEAALRSRDSQGGK